jgi:DNA-binding NtrC family response regulator
MSDTTYGQGQESAARLAIKRTALQSKMKKLGIVRPG